MLGDDDDDDLDEQFDHDRSNFLPWTTESTIDDIEKPRNKHFSRTKRNKNLGEKCEERCSQRRYFRNHDESSWSRRPANALLWRIKIRETWPSATRQKHERRIKANRFSSFSCHDFIYFFLYNRFLCFSNIKRKQTFDAFAASIYQHRQTFIQIQ